jgi:HK97 family phage prohead protease
MTTTTQSPRIDMLGGLEHRTFTTRLTTRDAGGLEFRLEGYASLTESGYDMGSYTESISRGAFTTTLAKNPDVQLLINHEGLPLARTTISPGQVGHLGLSEDDRGLHFLAQLDRDDDDARAVMRKVGNGLMDQCSFAFRVVDQDWNSDRTVRTIKEVSLDRGDVSVVNYGASAATSVQARTALREGSAAAAAARTRHLNILNNAGRSGNLSLYQARARATALRGRGHLSDNPNLAYDQAVAWALGCGDD